MRRRSDEESTSIMILKQQSRLLIAAGILAFLPSCSIKQNGVGVSMATDQVMPAANDTVYVEAGSGAPQTPPVMPGLGDSTVPANSYAHVNSSPGAVPASGESYTVRSGDTLYAVARRHGITLSKLAEANGLSVTDHLRIGQTLVIPRGSATTTTHSYGGSSRSYTVRSGDTLSSIAHRFGVSLSALLRANGLSSAQAGHLRVGQKLIIP